MQERFLQFDRVLSAILTVAVVVAVAILVEGRINPPPSKGKLDRIEFIKDWQSSVSKADISLGDSLAIVKIAVFTDFECPYCRRMDSVLTGLELQYPGKISRSIIQFPIPSHEYARVAADVFECARQQGRAAEMHHVLYVDQKFFGRTSWADYAVKAGVFDTTTFLKCLKNNPAESDISIGTVLGEKLAIAGTPAVIVNGWLFDPAMPKGIESAVTAAIQGKPPKH